MQLWASKDKVIIAEVLYNNLKIYERRLVPEFYSFIQYNNHVYRQLYCLLHQRCTVGHIADPYAVNTWLIPISQNEFLNLTYFHYFGYCSMFLEIIFLLIDYEAIDIFMEIYCWCSMPTTYSSRNVGIFRKQKSLQRDD